MNLLAPWALWFGAIAPVIVLLYLLKLRRRMLPVSTLLFWQRVLEENRRTALFQRLRNLLSLLLHLLIFALILLALAKPVIDRVIRQGASTVIVVDTRARMQAVDGAGNAVIERALRIARDLVGQATNLREVAIVSAGSETRVLAPFLADPVPLRRALESIRASDAGGDLQPALEVAQDILGSRAGSKRIVLLTDRASVTWKPTSADTTLDVQPVGIPSDNVAITRFAARPLPASTDTSEILLTVHNFGRSEFAGNVEVTSERGLLDVRPFRLAAGAQESLVFSSVPSAKQNDDRGLLTARIDQPDALAVDNEAYAVLANSKPRRVLLVSDGNWFLEKLLAADTRLEFEMLAPDAFRPEMSAQFESVIFDRVLPPGIDLAGYTSNGLFIRESPLTIAGPEFEQPLVSEVEENHPALRMVSLRNITIGRAASISVPAGGDSSWRWETPIRSFEHPLLATGERKRDNTTQRIAVLAFDLTASDLPLRIAFPLLLGNIIQWTCGAGVSDPDQNIRAGEMKEFASPVVISGPTLAGGSPDAGTTPAQKFAPLQNGFYQARANGTVTWIAVNTFDAGESDLLLADAGPVEGTSPAPQLPFGFPRGWPLWRFMALAAIGLLVSEWWLFHRRRTE